MNFFQAQDDARRKTFRLALLFTAALASLILLTNLLVAAVYVWTSQYARPEQFNIAGLLSTLPPETWALITVGVLGVVGVASLYKFLVVRGGGRTIAESLGGRLLSYDTTEGNTRRLLNIVEEMAIASGVPVPPVYLIPEQSINAFAAGFGPDDAIIGVNQGTIDLLNRDELQGVIAHEFSHILNGDVRINIRLIAALHGILFLGMVGYGILRGVGHGRRSSSNGNNSALPVLALGLGLLVIGYAGTFFGNLIKAAVSRQREYLADAAAVQFTRNPDGIAGALKKIGGHYEGSQIRSTAAGEASHMFFGQVRTLFLNRLTATHPPLDKRIRAVDPRWDGTYPVVAAAPGDERGGPEASAGFASAGAAAAGTLYTSDGTLLTTDAPGIAEAVGTLNEKGLAAARSLIATTDETLKEAAHNPYGARGLIYAILLDEDDAQRDRQFAHLQESAEKGVPVHTARLFEHLKDMDAAHRVTLVSMAVPALKALSRPQYDRFIGNVVTLIKMDQKISLPEWVLHRLLVKELRPHFEGPRRIRPRFGRIDQVADAAAVLLSTLAGYGHEDPEEQASAFAAGIDALELTGARPAFTADPDPNFSRTNEALRTLEQLKPLAKPRLIKACAVTAMTDGRVTSQEGALLQGVAAALDCPLPPSIYES
jgi:Zn-dependent protease with chaperone function